MKKLLWIVLPIALLGGAFAAWALRKPAMQPASTTSVAVTGQRLARGKYIFENLADCKGCHSPHHTDKFAFPIKSEMIGAGFEFPSSMGLPGRIVAPNLTPDRETGIGAWTDGEKIRAIREGVDRDGRALFPMMPYQHFAKMSDEDVASVVVYLNSMAPIRNPVPATEVAIPVRWLMISAPRPVAGTVPEPNRLDKVKYGEYLANLAGCGGCHSKADHGEPIAGREFAGGEPFSLEQFEVYSANITPEEETGIGKWTEDRFVAKFKGYANLTPENAPPVTQANFTVMPWEGFSKLDEGDLRAIYAYLRTLKPIYQPVERHPAKPVS